MSMLQLSSTLPPSPADIYDHLQQYRFDPNRQIKRPEAFIKVGDNILATPGNIMTIGGPVKAGKSGCVNAILAGTLAAPKSKIDTLGLSIKTNKDGKAVIHIDTEQSRYDHYHSMMQVVIRAARRSHVPEWLQSYNFQMFDVKDKQRALEYLCKELAQIHGGIHMILLDGGADFVKDTNDLNESSEIVQSFSRLAIQYNCPVLVVLHFNPGTDKGRGHFGSHLERKSETVISITKDKSSEISTIKGKFLRNSSMFPDLQFKYDQSQGFHVFLGTSQKPDMEAVNIKKLKDLAKYLFKDPTATLTSKQLYEPIMAKYKIQKRAAQDYRKKMVDANIITSPNTGYYTLISNPV